MSEATYDGWPGPEKLEPAGEQDPDRRRSLIECLHPTPPGFSACKNKTTYCKTCLAAFKC